MKYFYLQSILHDGSELKKKASDLFDYVKQKTGISFVDASLDDVKDENVSLVYVASGGTAGLFKEALPHLKEPVIIITSGSDNSLSASMEMMTHLANEGKNGRLLHGTKEEVSYKLEQITCASKAVKELKGLRLALVGRPSDWLISTAVDYEALKEKTGIEVIEISIEELISEIEKKSYPDNESCKALFEKDFDKNEIENSLAIYGAFSRLVEKYNLDGFSARCFDLLTAVKNSGCLGMALLNQEGIYSGCEADLPSLISMAILGKISGKPVFQCNPSRVRDGEIVFAHCTVPLNMPSTYTLDTHFESNIGVAVAGDIPQGPATVFKASGDLERRFISGAYIEEALHEKDQCRTQIRVSCKEDSDKFFNTPVGNHYLVCMGDYSEHLKEFFNLL